MVNGSHLSEAELLTNMMNGMKNQAMKHIDEDKTPHSEFENWTEEDFQLFRCFIKTNLFPIIDMMGIFMSLLQKEAGDNGKIKKYHLSLKDKDLERIQKRTGIGRF